MSPWAGDGWRLPGESDPSTHGELAHWLGYARAVDSAFVAGLAMPLPVWSQLVLVLAGAKTAVGLVAYLAGVSEPSPTPLVLPAVYALLVVSFAGAAGLLLLGSRRDVRAAWLGGVFVLIASAITPSVNVLSVPVPSVLAWFRPEALLPAFLWQFVRTFPLPLEAVADTWLRRLVGVMVAVGVLGALVHLSAAWTPLSGADWRRPLLAPDGLHWPLVLGLCVCALPVLLWRAGQSPAPERSRVQLFVRALLAGLAPFAFEVIAEALVPAYNRMTSGATARAAVGAVIFGPLATVPFVTAYSVLFDRVVETRVVLRAALQYALARYTIAVVTVIPFAALATVLVTHRDEPLSALLSGPRTVVLVGATVFGLVALPMRNRSLLAVDRRYFREPYDAREVLARFVGELVASSPAELGTRVDREIDRALHADAILLAANDTRTALRDVAGVAPPLAGDATLTRLAIADPLPMEVDLAHPESPLRRLPEVERRWLDVTGARLIVALRGSDGALCGVLAVTAKRSGLAFAPVDRQLIGAVAAAASLALENLRLRSTPPSPVEPPARECLACSRLHPDSAVVCRCGGSLAEARVPHVLRGTFRLDQRLGAGGMGVVYRAVDLHLGRDVAIKTLPQMSDAQASRLRREARAMAMVSHPHLAVVHGIETWRDVPFLVEEFLAGGTLASRLTAGPLPLEDVLDLGLALTDALQHLHAARLLHCDIKPSNIGFTAQGAVKLLDFGLARILREAQPPADVETTEHPGPGSALVANSTHGALAGTPFYMSPETVRGERPTPAVDLWSLAVVLYECLTGGRPFTGNTPAEIFAAVVSDRRPDIAVPWPACPPAVRALFARAFDLDARVRFRDAAMLRPQLRALRASTNLE